MSVDWSDNLPKLVDNLGEVEMNLNQRGSREVKIICSECSGLSNPLTVFFSEDDYLRSLDLSTREGRIRFIFTYRSSGKEESEELIGGCMTCGKRLKATLLFVKENKFPGA